MSFARRLAKAHEETSVRILVRIALDLACVGKSVSVVCGWSVWVLGAAIVKTLLSSKTNRMRDGSASSQIEGCCTKLATWVRIKTGYLRPEFR